MRSNNCADFTSYEPLDVIFLERKISSSVLEMAYWRTTLETFLIECLAFLILCDRTKTHKKLRIWCSPYVNISCMYFLKRLWSPRYDRSLYIRCVRQRQYDASCFWHLFHILKLETYGVRRKGKKSTANSVFLAYVHRLLCIRL